MNAKNRTRICLRLAPPVTAAIIAATAIPIQLTLPAFNELRWHFDFWDAVRNVLLFFPLGFTMPARSLAGVSAVAIGISASVEALQLISATRAPGFFDLISNLIGALAGFAIARMLWGRSNGFPTVLWQSRWLAALMVSIAASPLLGLLLPSHTPDFSNWDPHHQLIAGDEVIRGRPWKGKISEVAVFPAEIDGRVVRQLAELGVGSLATILKTDGGAPVYYWHLNSGYPILPPRPLLSPPAATSFFDTITRASRVSILVWIRTDDLAQDGPARIFTYSSDYTSRNFTIGQDRARAVFRLRTTATGANADSPSARSASILPTHRDVLITASYDGRVSRLYVDGTLASSIWMPNKRMPFTLHSSEYAIVAAICGALLAFSILSMCGSPRRGSRVMVAALAGLLEGIVLCAGASLTGDLRLSVMITAIACVSGAVVGLSIVAVRQHQCSNTE